MSQILADINHRCFTDFCKISNLHHTEAWLRVQIGMEKAF